MSRTSGTTGKTPNNKFIYKKEKPESLFAFRFHIEKNKQICKPGSVIENDHLSRPAVTDRLQPPPKSSRADLMLFHGVAPDRVYSTHASPRRE